MNKNRRLGNKKTMNIKELFENYCEKDDGGYVTHCHSVDVIPATEDQINTFIRNCKKYGVDENVVSDLVDYYKQCNSVFDYFTCDDLSLFEWWEDYKEIWLGCVDCDVFRYSSDLRKFAIGDAGNLSYGEEYEFRTIDKMIEHYLKEGRDIG